MRFKYGFGLLAAAAFLSTAAYADPIPPTPAPQPNPAPAPAAPTAADFAAMQADMKRMREELDRYRPAPQPNPPTPPAPDPSPDLAGQVRKNREAAETAAATERAMEQAVGFNVALPTWVKDNAELLPKEVPDIVALAAKEKYETQAKRAGAVKASIVESFFKVELNESSLTPAQRVALDDWRGLTKAAREESAADIYASIFEPALEALRRIRKAEEVGRANAGRATGTAVQNGYKDRLVALSRKTYLGVSA